MFCRCPGRVGTPEMVCAWTQIGKGCSTQTCWIFNLWRHCVCTGHCLCGCCARHWPRPWRHTEQPGRHTSHGSIFFFLKSKATVFSNCSLNTILVILVWRYYVISCFLFGLPHSDGRNEWNKRAVIFCFNKTLPQPWQILAVSVFFIMWSAFKTACSPCKELKVDIKTGVCMS